jgi:hypothetical protein
MVGLKMRSMIREIGIKSKTNAQSLKPLKTGFAFVVFLAYCGTFDFDLGPRK